MSTEQAPPDQISSRTSIDDTTEIDASLGASPHDCLTETSIDAPPTPVPRAKRFGVPPRSSVWRRSWKTPAGIVGFYLLALLCAVTHHSVFIYLNGRIVNIGNEDLDFATTTVPQTYATTISLALVTVFRAALVASVGLCYTQSLWKKLRTDVLEVGHIEELFQIRSNALRLLHPALVLYAPVLTSVAIISWLLPVAMIYPPGALVVGLEYRQVAEVFNVSVIPTDRGPISPHYVENSYFCASGLAELSQSATGCNITNITQLSGWDFFGSSSALRFVASTVLSTSAILDLSRPSRENSTYHMTFRGPMLQCDYENSTRSIDLNSTQFSWTHIWSVNLTKVFILSEPYTSFVMYRGTTVLVKEQLLPGGLSFLMPCPEKMLFGFDVTETERVQDSVSYHTLVRSVTVQTCVLVTARYDLNISFSNGTQHVSYSVKDPRKLRPVATSNQKHLQEQEILDAMALFDSIRRTLDVTGENIMDLRRFMNQSPTSEVFRLNNTDVRGCSVNVTTRNYVRGSDVFGMSAFNEGRRNPEWTVYSSSINLNESLLNEALANITISALTLNTYYGLVRGSSSRVFNVYHFEKRLSFYLPYGLSLLFALPILVLGLLALRYNGVAAIDGGFVQILMTTTGRTELEEAAIKGCLGGEENIPKELKKLKVRFGEMHTDDQRGKEDGLPAQQEYRANAPSTPASQSQYSDRTGEGINAEQAPVPQAILTPGDDEDITYDGNGVSSSTTIDQEGSHVVHRAGFGLLHETSPLKRGVQYGRLEANTEG